MHQWLKSMFSNHYIGAIVIALLITRGFEGIFSAISMMINMTITRPMRSSVFVSSPSIWTYAIPGLVTAILCFPAALILALWLYGKPHMAHQEELTEPLP